MQNLLKWLQTVDEDQTVDFMVKGHISLALENFPDIVAERAKIKEVAPLIEAMIAPDNEIKPCKIEVARLKAQVLRRGDHNFAVGKVFDALVRWY